MENRTFVGFGFGAIQAGLFLLEAYRSGNFNRLVVAEIMPEIVDAIRNNGGRYVVNVATTSGIKKYTINNIEIFNPNIQKDRDILINSVAEASEIATALPGVRFYGSGKNGDVVDIITSGLKQKKHNSLPAVIYTAENNNNAAKILDNNIGKILGNSTEKFQCLNTVIGKMSGVVTNETQINNQDLSPLINGLNRAFLVEEYNRILISKIHFEKFNRGIYIFKEKENLIPFEEAKLYGHNATHALLGYILRRKGYRFMADARKDEKIIALARKAFIEESGKALCKKYKGIDYLFTKKGYIEYVDDLIKRMLNPHLYDTVERITRDPERKLGWDDRLIGTMRMILSQGVIPHGYSIGAASALNIILDEHGLKNPGKLLDKVWCNSKASENEKDEIKQLVLKAYKGDELWK